MKILTHKQELCTGCQECELACSRAYFKTDDRNYSAIRIIENNKTYHANMCTQCGECIDMCTANAIYRDRNGVVRIDKKSALAAWVASASVLSWLCSTRMTLRYPLSASLVTFAQKRALKARLKFWLAG